MSVCMCVLWDSGIRERAPRAVIKCEAFCIHSVGSMCEACVARFIDLCPMWLPWAS